MRSYFFTAIFMLLATSLILIIPLLGSRTERLLASSQIEIPQKSSEVAGTFKFNLPPVSSNILPPPLSARALLVKDLETGSILYEKNAKASLPIASTTKIMTAIVSSGYFSQNTPLTASSSADIKGSSINLAKGEVLSFRSLLYGMLLNSGNDAAFAIAENYPGGVSGFVQAMNKKAVELGLNNTHFDNPAGFDNPNHFSSAADLSRVTEEALKDPTLVRIFATKETEIFSLDKKYAHQLYNLNRLLSTVAGVLGVKTGYTAGAKENLVTLVERKGHKILTVVLGSDDRFGESEKLIEWTYNNFIWD